MKSALHIRVLALGLCLLAAFSATPAPAAQMQSPPPLRLDAPEQEGSRSGNQDRTPAPVQAAAPVQAQPQTDVRQDNAAAPALPPLSPQPASGQNAAGQASSGQSATGQSEAGKGATDKSSASVPLPDLNFAWGGYFQALGLLCLILAALWALLWFFKRRGGLGGFMLSGSQVMRIESRLALGPKKWIIVIRYLDRRLVMGVTDQNISMLAEFRDEEESCVPENKSGAVGKSGLPDLSFEELMNRGRKEPETDAG